ncbi:MAG: NADH-quinone oxidoreductase subunit N [Prevotella sp.]|nr:NADH-quinone oxidoreductase subunit N [Prevotella sp.]
MNYSQFLNMIPEATLVLALIIVFCADFALHKSERKNFTLGVLTGALLLCQLVPCFIAEPTEAFGGIYVSTQIANVMKVILTAGTFIVVVMSQAWLETTKRYAGEYYMLLLSTLLGMYMMLSSGSFLMFFLGLEMASVPLACMVALDKKKKESAEAAAKYILIATFSSGVMLFGISFIYAATGSLYFDNVAEVITAKPLSIIGMVFFFSGLGFKISLVPFHFWTADTYQGAPTPVTGYLSVVSKGAATLTLAIILTKVFGSIIHYWQPMLWVVIMLTITIGNLMAIRQTELKRFMAFSSISQAGYIMLAVIGADPATSQTALTFYVLVYVVANMSVFSVISAVEHMAGAGTQMSAYNGLYQTNPKLAFIMTIALFSLAGIPPFAGMFSKFFVFMAGVNGQDAHPFWPYFVVFVALVNTVVSLYYYLLIVKAMYIRKEDNPLPAFAHGKAINASLAICTVGIVLFGICSCIYQWIANAAGM